ncbi:adenylate kinase [Fragilaria crotonensis]|nr:adenylate kinase [Fragilaria crotonensis]
MVANQLEQEGTANATLADIRDIRDKEKVKMPQDLHQVSLALQRYAVLVHTLFQGPGEPNPFVRRCMWHLASTYHERLPHFLSQHQTLAGTPWGEIYPAHVIRNVQIHVYEYLQALQIGGVRDGDGTIALPSFHELLRDYQRGSFHMSPSWLPRLPAGECHNGPSGNTTTIVGGRQHGGDSLDASIDRVHEVRTHDSSQRRARRHDRHGAESDTDGSEERTPKRARVGTRLGLTQAEATLRVNPETSRLAPHEAMQFGRALSRMLARIVHADPRYGPVYLAKFDIADGFYRISLRPYDIPRLGVVLPSTTDNPVVALPLALPMGWVESPPYYTAVTETACDLLNTVLRRHVEFPPHRLEDLAATLPSDATPLTGARWQGLACTGGSACQPLPPVAYGDVYVDAFILTAQTKRHQQRVLRAVLHSIDTLLRPLDTQDRASRKEPVSVKKLRQGDACWLTSKTDAFRGDDSTRVRLTRRVFDSLADFGHLRTPSAIGPRASAKWFQLGRLWPTEHVTLVATNRLVTSDNRQGTVSISDLELAGTLAHKDILARLTCVAECPIWLAGDNRASLSWATKGSSTATTARAYLLRLSALHQRHFRYVSSHDFIAGKASVMADDASRRWDLTDADLVSRSL